DRIAKWIRDMVGIAKAGAFNFGVTAHPFEWYDPKAEEDVWAPWVQGKNMSPKICGYMNIVAYLEERRTEKGVQRVLTVDQKGFVGKDQLFCIPELKSGTHGIVEPTMSKLETAINSSSKRNGSSNGKPARKKAGRKIVRKAKRK